MEEKKKETKSNWENVSQAIADQKTIVLGPWATRQYQEDPQTMLSYLTGYKLIAKLIGKEKRVLDVHCNEGLGTYVLAKECGFAKGIDPCEMAIHNAADNFQNDQIVFEVCSHPMRSNQGLNQWDAIVHWEASFNDCFLENYAKSIVPEGIIVLGISDKNLMDKKEVKNKMHEYFTHVFLFSLDGEIIQAGYAPFTNRLIVVGCQRKF